MPGNTTTAVCSSVLQLQYPDAQCACSRQGYLCGACVSGLSVTAVLSTCKSCDNTWIIGIVLLSESMVPSTSWSGGCVCVTACVHACVSVCVCAVTCEPLSLLLLSPVNVNFPYITIAHARLYLSHASETKCEALPAPQAPFLVTHWKWCNISFQYPRTKQLTVYAF